MTWVFYTSVVMITLGTARLIWEHGYVTGLSHNTRKGVF